MKYHFIGIGGIGMGTLASLMLDKGHSVSGSDVKDSHMTLALKQKGAQVFIGHRLENIQDQDVVVYSSAISAENPELFTAHARKIQVLKRAELLAQIMANHVGITVAGAHGKTTTTSMISHLLISAGLNPSTAVGGIINGDNYNANLGAGTYFVAEVDESDGSFLYFSPKYSVITNVDFEHVDFYQNWENILSAYETFLSKTQPGGCAIICGDDERLKRLAVSSKKPFLSYGFGRENHVFAERVRFVNQPDCFWRFDCMVNGRRIPDVELSIPGEHNILNALACVTVGCLLNITPQKIKLSLKKFTGVNRRFQRKGLVNDIMIVDDYGHHPTEIKATLATANSVKQKRVITIFQPHRYSRTKFLMDDFARELLASDLLIVTDIYAASESPLEGVTAQTLVDKIKSLGRTDVLYLKRQEIAFFLLGSVRPGDLVLTLGAGDIYQVGEDLYQELKKRSQVKGPQAAAPDPRDLGRIGVLMGGVSSEKDISLKSGSAVLDALERAGCDVVKVEVWTEDERSIIELLKSNRVDIVFNVLHGRFGEDGGIQRILEKHGVPYVGSGPQASQLAMDKSATQSVLHKNAVPVADFVALEKNNAIDPARILKAVGGCPLVVKPSCEGSSIGITVVGDPAELTGAIANAFQFGPRVLIEQYIVGREITSGILGHDALPLVEIKPHSKFFDFTAKYQKGLTDYIVPAPLAADVALKVQSLSLKVFDLLGCRDMARSDFIIDEQGNPYFLEINTLPGFTATSLLPQAARYAGIDFSELCLRLLAMARARCPSGKTAGDDGGGLSRRQSR